MKIYPYKPSSQSAKNLANALGIKRIKHQGRGIIVRDVLINWGASHFKRVIKPDYVLNEPEAVARASNKLETFKALEGKVGIPDFTTELEEAVGWVQNDITVVARTTLNGHSGEGIVLVTPDDYNNNVDVPAAPLYTKYIPKSEEYRIHVFQDDAFFVQRKARKKDVADADVNWKIRNHSNGFIYAHQGVEVSDEAKAQAVLAVQALGLDFGAVDIIYNKKQDKYYILEVNTACGLEGETLARYVEKFNKFR